MRKIEFDYLQKKFSIETDEAGDLEFINEYTTIFLDAIKQSPVNPNVQDDEQKEAPEEEDFDIIDLFGINARQLAKLVQFEGDKMTFVVRDKYILGDRDAKRYKLALLYCGFCSYKGVVGTIFGLGEVLKQYGIALGEDYLTSKILSPGGIVARNRELSMTMPAKDALYDLVKEIFLAMKNDG